MQTIYGRENYILQLVIATPIFKKNVDCCLPIILCLASVREHRDGVHLSVQIGCAKVWNYIFLFRPKALIGQTLLPTPSTEY